MLGDSYSNNAFLFADVSILHQFLNSVGDGHKYIQGVCLAHDLDINSVSVIAQSLHSRSVYPLTLPQTRAYLRTLPPQARALDPRPILLVKPGSNSLRTGHPRSHVRLATVLPQSHECRRRRCTPAPDVQSHGREEQGFQHPHWQGQRVLRRAGVARRA